MDMVVSTFRFILHVILHPLKRKLRPECTQLTRPVFAGVPMVVDERETQCTLIHFFFYKNVAQSHS